MNQKKLLPILFILLLSLPLFGQYNPIDSLAQLSPSASIKERVLLKNQLEDFFKKNKNEALIDRYLEIAQAKKDSIFLGSAYYLAGKIEQSQNIKRQYGILLDDDRNEIPLYHELSIYHDVNGLTTFEEVKNNNQLFSSNYTSDNAFNYNPNEVYWAKLILHGNSEKADDYVLHLSQVNAIQRKENISSIVGTNTFKSWDHIEAWIESENDSILHFQTGNKVLEGEKPIPSLLNLLRFSIRQKEKTILYIRMQGAEDKRIQANAIKFFLIDSKDFPGFYTGYPFTGKFFHKKDIGIAFSSNTIFNHKLYVDANGELTIDDILNNNQTLEWQPNYKVKHELNNVYWMKTRFYGSSYFNGEQLLHISPFPGNEMHSFDYIDTYILNSNNKEYTHQRTGTKVRLKDRPLEHWVNFIKMDIDVRDTLDVYIRMEGSHPEFLIHHLGHHLFHVDPSSLFPSQSKQAFYNGLFIGILAIQFVFFLLLFMIEKEWIHFYFSILVLGAFLGIYFTGAIFSTYVLFPTITAYYPILLAIGMFCIIIGLLKFVENFFNYSKSSFFSKYLVPGFLILSSLVCINYVLQHNFLDENLAYYGHQLYFKLIIGTVLLALIITVVSIFKAPKQKSASKLFLLIAFFPPLIVCIAYVAHVLWTPEESTTFEPYLRMAIVAMITLLALSMGYRTNRLKEERADAIEESLMNQQATLRSELLAENLQKLNQSKTQFYTNITHEFRTPLTVIMGINEELQRSQEKLKLSDTKKQKLAQGHDLIQRNSQNLLQLINQLLDLSKADSGMLSLNLVQRDIVPYLNYLTESFYSKAKEKDIRLVFYPEIEDLIMDFDEAKIQQMVYNLLSNALKFTPEKGKVVLHIQEELENGQAFMKMKVSDNGNGIDAEKLPHIFDRFYQADDSSTRSEEGTGIGLALTKDLVDLMQGTIAVESKIDKGTSFTIILPVQNKAALATSNELAKLDIAPPLSKATETLPISGQALVDSDLPLILIVEDNPDVTIYIQQLLENNYQIQTANNGEAGIAQALEIIPDIIISDVMMPKKDGFELTQTLKADTRTSHIPIVLLTAKATETDKIAGLKTGADAYLTKPFNKEELYLRLENLMHLRQALQKQFSASNLNNSEAANPTKTDLTLEEQFIQKLKNLVHNHLNDPDLNTEKLCKEVELSQSQLYRKLKALTNETPNAFIRHIRLHKAMELLKTTNLNVSEIAYDVGFNDPAYFSRSFVKLFGNPPSFFRT